MVILQKLFFLSVFPKVENLCLSTGTCSRPFVINNFNPTINVRWYFRQLYLPTTTLTLIWRVIFITEAANWLFWKQVLFGFRAKEKRLLVSPNPARSINSIGIFSRNIFFLNQPCHFFQHELEIVIPPLLSIDTRIKRSYLPSKEEHTEQVWLLGAYMYYST